MENDSISKYNDFIYLGSYLHPVNNSDEFKQLNIDVIINCSGKVSYPKLKNYTSYKFNIYEGDSISMMESVDSIADIIHDLIGKKKNIYLHCTNGLSIVPTVLIYYYMTYHGKKYEDIFQEIKNVRPNIKIEPEFNYFLIETENIYNNT